MKVRILVVLVLLLAGANLAFAQSTEFTYQGSLRDGSTAAGGNYDFEFRLFSVEAGGSALATNARPNVSVSNGIFTVRLDFGTQFPGANRFLEIAVKPAGGPSFTPLTPRQSVTSSPYNLRSLSAQNADTAANAANATLATNSGQLGGVAANQFVLTTDSRMSDARDPLPGSVRYVQNGLAQQAASSFNISGDGTANIFRATTQFNIGNNRVLSIAGIANTFVGLNAGTASTGNSNSFFGNTAGGGLNNSGNANSFFGERAGALNTTGAGNAFVGSAAGVSNTSGQANSFFGLSAGASNTTGASNSFLGVQAGFTNTTGSNNTMVGAGTNVGSGGLSFATAIGAGAVVTHSNTIVVGRSNNSDSIVLFGPVSLSGAPTGLSINACLTNQVILGICSSSLRYKLELQTFSGGLDIVRRLRPIAFTWKDGGTRDVGFGAEEVEKIEPLLVTYYNGKIEGVKYGQITTVLVNAVNEQQKIIENQQKQIDEFRQRQLEIDELKQIVCALKPDAAACKEKRK